MPKVDDQDRPKSSGYQSFIALITGTLTVVSAVGTAAWFVISPRLDQYVDGRVAASKSRLPQSSVAEPGAHSSPGSTDFDPSTLRIRVDDLAKRIEQLSSKLSETAALQEQYNQLKKDFADLKVKANIAATYGYSFRFKGAEILAQHRPPSRLFFYATPDDEVKVSVYLGNPKFPVTLKVDGTPVRPIIRDSRESIRVTDQLVQTSLEEVTAVKETAAPGEGVPPSVEDPRPKYVHYIEFVPGDVSYQFGSKDDYDVAGIVLVTKKSI
jgi:hypothetical protein